MPLSASTIEGRYPGLGSLTRIRVTARDGNGQWKGRVLAMVLVGKRGSVSLTGDQFRLAFGLRSSWFSF